MKIKKKTIILMVLIFCILAVGKAFAVPACPEPFKVKQPDGKEFMARLFGDEWYNGIETTEGYTIFKEPSSGYWVYAKKASSGELYPSDLVVGFDPPLEIQKHLRDEAAIQMIPSRRYLQAPPEYVKGVKPPKKQYVIVFLIEFTDQNLVLTKASDWKTKMFGNKKCSVKHFFREVSYKWFNITPGKETNGKKNDGIVKVKVDMNHPDTGGNSGYNNRKIVWLTLIAANKFINYKRFDTNKDGGISNDECIFLFICAGYETSYGGSTYAKKPNVWGHKWNLFSGESPKLDGVYPCAYAYGGGYLQVGEVHAYYYQTGHSATKGILCHEIGHLAWKLPDLYDTDYSSVGLGYWCLMATGSWNGVTYLGDSPAHPSAWCKYFCKLVVVIVRKQGPREATALKKLPINQVENNKKNSVYLLGTNPNGPEYGGKGEYFILENRQKYGYDAALPGAGIMIYHIDEKMSNNTNEGTTKSGHRLVDIEEADGLEHLSGTSNKGDTGDPFPGSTNNKKFTKTTKPNSKLYGGKNSKVQVTTISKSGKKMTAKLSGK